MQFKKWSVYTYVIKTKMNKKPKGNYSYTANKSIWALYYRKKLTILTEYKAWLHF